MTEFNTLESTVVIGGRYRLRQPLGRGSYGETYLAEDLHLPGNPICVVKKFSPQNTSHHNLELGYRLFEQEANILYRLGKHEQVPQLLAHFVNQDDSEYYIVQEFIEGQDLTEEVQRGLSEADVVQLLIDVLEVLQYIHSEHVIHRDLKPSNIMRRIDRRIVLIDFGAVKEVSFIEDGQVSSTVAIGTRGYTPSEQANHKPRLASDIYAVGMIAIQALTKIHPRDLSDDPRTGEIIWQEYASVSDGLASVINKMIRYHFPQRYQTVSEVLVDLNRLQNSSYVDLVSRVRESLEELRDDIRMVRGGIVLPQVRLFLLDKIENFENLYAQYTASFPDKRLSTFLQKVCLDTDFEVDATHPAMLVLRSPQSSDRTIHTEESYRQILMSGHRKFKLSSPRDMISVARRIVQVIQTKPIIGESFSNIKNIVSRGLPLEDV